MRINRLITISIVNILVWIILIINASAATVEMISGKLPTQLYENDQINFTIKIKDYDDVQQLTLETNVVPYGDKPLYDFGELNQFINENRYQQKIILNVSSLQQKFLYVSISGKVPEGETRIKSDKSDIVISKFTETKLKFYEVRADQKLAGIESFELIIKKKEDFDKTINKITWKELDGMKREVKKLFDYGLTTEAQNIANEMSNIKIPNSLLLFGIIKVESDTMLNGIAIALILIVFVIGYVVGAGKPSDDEDDI